MNRILCGPCWEGVGRPEEKSCSHGAPIFGTPTCTRCGAFGPGSYHCLGSTSRLTPLRGRVVIREIKDTPGRIVLPDDYHDNHKRDVKLHRGYVLAMGPPARLPSGVEVPPGFRVGDTVLYVWSLAGTEASRTSTWTDDGPCAWVAQEEVIGIEETT